MASSRSPEQHKADDVDLSLAHPCQAHILRIPAELRETILSSVFKGEIVWIEFGSTTRARALRKRPAIWHKMAYDKGSRASAILQTCYQLYTEGLPVFHTNIEFCTSFILQTTEYYKAEEHRRRSPVLQPKFEDLVFTQRQLEQMTLFKRVHLMGCNYPETEVLPFFPNLRHLTSSKTHPYSSLADLHNYCAEPLEATTAYHAHTEDLIGDPRIRLWIVNGLISASKELRQLSGIGSSSSHALSVTSLWATTVIDDPSPTYIYYRLILQNDDNFMLEYTVGDRTFVAKQLPLS